MLGGLKTAVVVVVLSCLIWVFAERSKTQTISVALQVALPNSGELLVQYLDNRDMPVPDDSQEVKVVLEGPTGRVQDVAQAAKEGPLDPVRLTPKELGYVPTETDSETFTVDIVEKLLQGGFSFQRSYLKVNSSAPASLKVRVTRLVQQAVPVRVLDENDNAMTLAKDVEVLAYILAGTPTQATVRLDAARKRMAVSRPIEAQAKVRLPNRTDSYLVQVQVQAEAVGPAQVVTIQKPQLVYLMPPTMQGRYKVVLDDSALYEYTPIKYEGSQNYKNSRYHLALEIYDGDQHQNTVSRRLRYYYLDESNPIRIIDPRQKAIRFHLEEIGKTVEE